MSLTVVNYTFDPALVAVSPTGAVETGGTAVLITGRQFADGGDGDGSGIAVYFGGAQVDPSRVSLRSETEIAVVAPPHAPGLVDIRVAFPSGVEKTLPGAFAFVLQDLLTVDGVNPLLTGNGDPIVV